MRWTKEERTNEFQFLRVRIQSSQDKPAKCEKVLQQKWLIATGGTGEGVKYDEVWRDVEIVDAE